MQQVQHEEGYYEYMVLSLKDRGSRVDPQELCAELNKYGKEGWEIKAAYSNELGKNSIGLVLFTLNWTKDQNVIIMQRFVKKSSRNTNGKKPSKYDELLAGGAITEEEYTALVNKEQNNAG